MTEMRLQRALARAGVASRRAAEELIRAGRVKVNGTVALIGMKVNADTDVITVGRRRVTQVRKVWIALHKPVGYVVTKRDPQRRQTIFELVPDVPGMTYVGRLDVMTSGLLLLTNDGEAAHQLMHPKFEVERSYRVVVHGKSDEQIHAAFSKPIVIEGRAVNVKTLKTRPDRANSIEMLLVVAEGRYRIVRRICEKLGLAVERLVRLTYGPIRLGDLAPSTWRYLTRSELAALASMWVK
ncbi:MAG: rRNA pseudouridine synthase [Gemmatimonadetes bacterium]|nr:rRNA pseudouridine synthase [Gemmatimonadota bacterium]